MSSIFADTFCSWNLWSSFCSGVFPVWCFGWVCLLYIICASRLVGRIEWTRIGGWLWLTRWWLVLWEEKVWFLAFFSQGAMLRWKLVCGFYFLFQWEYWCWWFLPNTCFGKIVCLFEFVEVSSFSFWWNIVFLLVNGMVCVFLIHVSEEVCAYLNLLHDGALGRDWYGVALL